MSDQDNRETQELLYDVFQVLYEAWVENQETPKRFVGLQGNTIAILTPGQQPAGLVLMPGTVTVAP